MATRCRHCNEWISPEALAEREQRMAREALEAEKAQQDRRAAEEHARAEAERVRRAAEERARAEAEKAMQERLEAEEKARKEAELIRMEAESNDVLIEDVTVYAPPMEACPPPPPVQGLSDVSSGVPFLPPPPPVGEFNTASRNARPPIPSRKAGSSKAGIWVLIVVLVVAVAGTVFYFVGQNKERRYQNVEFDDFSDVSSEVYSRTESEDGAVEEMPVIVESVSAVPEEAPAVEEVYFEEDEDYSDEGTYW